MHLPPDLAAALHASPDALHYFESLPSMQQQSLLLGIEEAGDRALRRRRVETAARRLGAVTCRARPPA